MRIIDFTNLIENINNLNFKQEKFINDLLIIKIIYLILLKETIQFNYFHIYQSSPHFFRN